MIGLSLALALLAARETPPPPPLPAEILRPVWLATPSEDDYLRAYPEGLDEMAFASLICRVAGDGGLVDCKVGTARPQDRGVEAGALSLAPRFRLATEEVGGRSTVGREVEVQLMWMYRTGQTSSYGARPFPIPPPDPGFRPSILTMPDWREPPDPQVFARLYPEAALREEVGGWVTLDCLVAVDGRVFECVAESEYPVGLGFAEATLAASATFRMKPATRDGQPFVTRIKIPMGWSLPEPLPAAKKKR